MIEKIEQKQIDDNSVSKLSTRPNAPSAMGGNGLNAAELRARFDALAKLAIDKINEILAYLNGDELKDGTTAPPFASLIKFTGDGGTYTLYEVLEWLQSKDFAEKIILSEDGKYTLAQFYDDFNEWLAGTGFAEKINLVAVANGENYTLAQFFQDFNITPSFGTLVGVEHSGNEIVDYIHGDGISYKSKINFIFQDFCYPANQEFPNETLIPIVAGDHIEFSTDDRDKVVEISAIVEQSFNANSTEAQSGKAVSGAIQPLSESIAQIQNKISSLEAQVDLYPLFTFHSNQNMEAIVSGYTDTISFNRVVDGKTEEVFNKEPSVGDIFFAYGQSADGVRFHMTAVITAIDDTDNPSQATFKALEVYEDAGEGGISIDPNYDPNSLNAQSGKAVAEAIESVEEQIPLVLPYIFKWGKNAPITQGETNTVAAKYFNRIPKKDDHFFGYFYIESIENGEITHKDYHVSAKVIDVPKNVQPDNAITFEVLEAVQFIPTVDQAYQPTSTNPQSGKAVAQAIADAPKEVHNITSIDETYDTVESLPPSADNGTTYFVVNGYDEDDENPAPSLYAYNGSAWEFKAKLKAHTLYCVLTGKNSGIYRYTMSEPYLVLAEQAVEERANQKFSNAATAHKEGTTVAITDISPITHGVRVWDKANPDRPVSVYLSENEYDPSTTVEEQKVSVVKGDGFIRVIPKSFDGGVICAVCSFTAKTSGTYHFSCDFSHTGTVTSPLNRENEILFFIDGAYLELVKLTNGANTTYVLKNIPAGSVIKASFYPSVTGAEISTNYVATLSNIFIGESAMEVEVEAGGTVSSRYPDMAIIAKDTSTTLAVEYNRDINKVEAGLKSYIERLLGVIENGTY